MKYSLKPLTDWLKLLWNREMNPKGRLLLALVLTLCHHSSQTGTRRVNEPGARSASSSAVIDVQSKHRPFTTPKLPAANPTETFWSFQSARSRKLSLVCCWSESSSVYSSIKEMWHLSFTKESVFFFFSQVPGDTLSVQPHRKQKEQKELARAHTSAHARTHSLACILHTHGGEQVTDTRSSRMKAGHLTWSSTRWATTAAASSVSASLRGRILRATCGTKRGNSPQIQRRPKAFNLQE